MKSATGTSKANFVSHSFTTCWWVGHVNNLQVANLRLLNRLVNPTCHGADQATSRQPDRPVGPSLTSMHHIIFTNWNIKKVVVSRVCAGVLMLMWADVALMSRFIFISHCFGHGLCCVLVINQCIHLCEIANPLTLSAPQLGSVK